jgi:hypothetical protein
MAAYIGAQLDVKIRTGKRHMARRRGPWCSTMVGKCLPEWGATLERLDSVIATLPSLRDQRIAAGCHLEPQGQGPARHGSASVRTGTQTMPASATNHTRGCTPAHARMPSCAECERGMDFIQWRDGEKREPLTHVTR